MPTQPQIDAILAKVETYQTKKALSDAAQRASDTASQRANAARGAWDAMIGDGETDEVKLTAMLNAVVDTGLEAATKQADLQTASGLTSSANTQLGDAVYLLVNPPPPEP
ncbi:MAG TPA: hypothetical protein VK550_12355 [Polyangiaceae bacterium]|nr:hypothetical protein [Polyangiaceae bacterium]